MSANPFVGPRSFRTGERLFGRDRELRRLLDLLIAERIVLLHAPSGAGKTSLVQAALVPALRAEGFVVLPPIRVSLEPPGALALAGLDRGGLPDADPFLSQLLDLDAGARPDSGTGSLPASRGITMSGRAVRAAADTAPLARPAVAAAPNRYVLSALLSLEEGLPAEEQLPLARLAAISLAEYLDHRAAGLAPDDGLVLLFDQFEEILTVDPSDIVAKEQFFVQVGAALYDRTRWALFSMREDYVGGIEPYLRPIPTQLGNTFHLDLLDLRSALAAMQGPVASDRTTFTDAAARQLADDLRRVRILRADGSTEEQLGPFIEPVQLQVVCYRLWERLSEDDDTIDVEDVLALGNVDQALTGYYAERVTAIAAATGVSKRAIRDWCEHDLITEQGIRGQVIEGAARLDARAVRALVDAHLVRGEKRRGSTWFELAHDRLIAPVKADNAAWREAHLSPLQRQAALWERQARPGGMLFGGEALAEAEAWAATHREALTSSERDFLVASAALRAAEERERRATRRIRWLGIASAVFGVIAIGVAIFAFVAYQDAERQKDLAEIRQIAAEATESRLLHPVLATLLAVEIYERSRVANFIIPEAESALRQSLAEITGQSLVGLKSSVSSLSFSHDGRMLAGTDDDGRLVLWGLDEAGSARRLPDLHGEFSRAAFSPSSDHLAAVSNDGTVSLWRTDALDAPPLPLTRADRGQTSDFIAYSPDGNWLAAVGGTAAYVWDTSRLEAPPRELLFGDAFKDQYMRMDFQGVFSPRGRYLAVIGFSSLLLWDLASSDQPRLVSGHTYLAEVAFSPDERFLATSSDDGARVWDLTNLNEPKRLFRTYQSFTMSVAFSPDGALLATGEDAVIRLWNMSNLDAKPRVLRGHEGVVLKLAFSGDGRRLFSSSADATVRVWQVDDPAIQAQVLRSNDGEAPLAVDLAHGRVARGDSAGGVRLWDTVQPDAGAGVKNLILDARAIDSVHFLDGGKTMLVSAPETDKSYLLDLSAIGQRPPQEIPALVTDVTDDKRFLLTRNARAKLQRWDRQNLARVPPEVLIKEDEEVWGFSSDGRYVLVQGDGQPVRRLDLEAPDAPALTIPNSEYAYVFPPSADGQFLSFSLSLYGEGGRQMFDLRGERPQPVTFPSADTTIESTSRNYLITSSGDEYRLHTYADLDGPGLLLSNPDGEKEIWFEWNQDDSFLLGQTSNGVGLLWEVARPEDPPRRLSPMPAYDVSQFTSRYLVWYTSDEGLKLLRLGRPASEVDLLEESKERGDAAQRFSLDPSGRYLFILSKDQAWAWDLTASSLKPYKFRGKNADIRVLAINPQGNLLAAGDADGRILLRDLRDPKSEPITLPGHSGAIIDLGFTPDGQLLISAGQDGVVRAWSTDGSALITDACQAAGRNLDWDEWNRYFGDESYHKTCPGLPAHPSFLESARDLARDQKRDEALARFREAVALDPELGIDPEREYRRGAAEGLVMRGSDELSRQNFAEALDSYSQARELDPANEDALFGLCYSGSLSGAAKLALPACDAAVAARPEASECLDARARARALTGDFAGAAADLELVVANPPAYWDEETIARRQTWLADLGVGKNPYTEEVLEGLREGRY